MASHRRSRTLLLLVVGVFLCFCGVAQAKVDKKVVATSRKEDVPFIKCSVCEAIAKQLMRQVKEKREKAAPKKLTELQIIDVAENICNMKKEESDWILRLDIVEKGDKLQLVEQPQEGVCKTECKTIERACQEVMGDSDTDVAEYLYKEGATRAGLQKLLCKDLSKACVGKPPRVPKDRQPGEAFTPKPSKEAEMEKLMRSMSDMPGAPGMKMYSREELTRNPRLMDGSYNPDDFNDDDEDEDEDEESAETKTPVRAQARPSATRAAKKGSVAGAWRDAVGKLGVQVGVETRRAVQGALQRVDRAAEGIRSWWHGKSEPVTKASPRSNAKPKSSSDPSSGEL